MSRLASYVVENAVVRTLDARDTVAGSLVVREGVVAGVDEEAPGLPRIDAGGRTVVPGLVDGHAHLDREGLRTVFASLAGVHSIAGLLGRIAALVAEAEPGAWVVTMPIGEPPQYRDVPGLLAEGRFPTRWELDRVAPDNPVFIRPIWGYWRHELPLVSVLNSAGLAAAGLDRTSVPPAPEVTYERGPDGDLTGLVVEQTPIPVFELFLPAETRFSLADRIAALPRSAAAYAATGTTSAFEAHGLGDETLAAYRAVAEHTVRTQAVLSPDWLDADPVEALRELAPALAGAGTGDDRFRLRGIFVEPHVDPTDVVRAQAAPYTGWAGFSYAAGVRPDRVRELLRTALDLDVRVVLMGTSLLPLLTELDATEPLAGRRWTIGHVSTIDTHQVRTIRRLGLCVTTHTNRYLYKQSEALAEGLGYDREHDLVPLRSLLAAGVPVSFGTDNVPTSLWHPIWHAVSRRGRATGRVVGPGERISRAQALRIATQGGAHLLGEEDRAGCLTPGRRADLAVLDRDPATVPEEELPQVRSLLTIVGDRVAWSSGEVWETVP